MKKLIDFVKVYDKALSDEMCDSIIKGFEKDKEHHITSGTGAQSTGNLHRNAIELNTTQRALKSSRWKVIMEIMNKHAVSSFERYKHDLITNGYKAELLFNEVTLEQWRMHRYDPSIHYYKEHIDAISYHTSKRMLMMLYYLNTVEEGGETLFESIDKRVNPVKGKLAITPCWFGFPHSAVMPTSNPKYMIKTYLHYPGEH